MVVDVQAIFGYLSPPCLDLGKRHFYFRSKIWNLGNCHSCRNRRTENTKRRESYNKNPRVSRRNFQFELVLIYFWSSSAQIPRRYFTRTSFVVLIICFSAILIFLRERVLSNLRQTSAGKFWIFSVCFWGQLWIWLGFGPFSTLFSSYCFRHLLNISNSNFSPFLEISKVSTAKFCEICLMSHRCEKLNKMNLQPISPLSSISVEKVYELFNFDSSQQLRQKCAVISFVGV